MTSKKIAARIAYWQKRMGLGGWELWLSDHAPDADALATTHPEVTQRQAAICIHPDAPDDQVDRLIVHELAHVLTCEMADLFHRATADHGSEAQAFMEGQWERASEWVMERLASALTGQTRVEFNKDAPPVWKSVHPI